MRKRWLAAGLTILIAIPAAGWLVSCGGGSSTTTTSAGIGSTLVFLKDAPFCDVLSFRANIGGLSLRSTSSGTGAPILSTATTSIPINFTLLRDFSTLLALSGSIGANVYDKANITISSPTIIVYDPTHNPPFRGLLSTLTTGTAVISADITPPLTISNGHISALQIDLDVLRSLQTDSTGQLTGAVTPTFAVSPLSADSSTKSFLTMDDLFGFVRSVSNTAFNSGGNSFTGSLSLQTLSSPILGVGGPALSVSLTSATQICAPPETSNAPCTPQALNTLLTGSFAEVDATADSSGNIQGTTVLVEDQEDVTSHKLAFVGTVLGTTQDAGGNVTQLQLFVRDEEPNADTTVPLDQMVFVNLSPATLYESSSPSTNFANLDFGPTAFVPGQEIVVHGVYTVPPVPPGGATRPPPQVAADKVYVKPDAYQGSFGSLVMAGSDDRTGAFSLAPCGKIFKSVPIMVFTGPTTSFVNVAGLSGLTPQPTLLVKGLLFYESQATTIEGVSVPVGSMVLLASEVHRLT
jgi:hypothetical protein